MNFEYSSEQVMLARSVRRFVQDHYDLERRRSYLQEPASFNQHNWEFLADLGLIGLFASTEAGGLAGTMADIAIVMEELGYGLIAEPILSSGAMGAGVLTAAGPSSLIEQWAPDIIAGTRRLALAYANPGPRAANAWVPLGLTKRDGRQTLDGVKSFVLHAAGAAALIVIVECAGDVDAWLIPADREGMSRQNYRLTDGSIATEITFSGCVVTPEDRLSLDARRWEHQRLKISVAACAEIMGIMRRLFEETCEYLKTRSQFGVAIGSFQALQHKIAKIYVNLEQSRSLLLQAVATPESDSIAWRRAALECKIYCAHTAMKLAEDCVQLHGGMGITDELSVGHALRRIMVLRQICGDVEDAKAAYALIAA